MNPKSKGGGIAVIHKSLRRKVFSRRARTLSIRDIRRNARHRAYRKSQRRRRKLA